MQAICPNPECGVAYTLKPENVGGQFACRKCGTLLRVESDGLHFAAGEAAPVHHVAASPAAKVRTLSARTLAANPIVSRMKTQMFDLLFGTGAVLVILFTFFPVLDQLRHVRYTADIDALRTQFKREDRDRTAPLSADNQKARDKKLQDAQDAADDEAASLMYSGWWYGWGMLLGFLMLIVASIAWLNASYSRTHRVVAAVVICTELLLVFIVYVVRSQSATKFL